MTLCRLAAVLLSVLCVFPAAQPATAQPALTGEGGATHVRETRGLAVYQRYCLLCHGSEADGRGIAARLYTPGPANLRISPFPDEYKELIIREGGAAVGRSGSMPPWGKELSDEDIKSVVAYLRVIKASVATPDVIRTGTR
jgi:mono/diheme cytochrome c family protein